MAYERKIPVDLDCPLRLTQSLIGAKWKPCILDELRGGKALRPSELCRHLPDAPPRVLAMQIRELLEDGLISKRQISESPPHSEYNLMETGRSLLPVIDHMISWGALNFDLFVKKFAHKSSGDDYWVAKKGDEDA